MTLKIEAGKKYRTRDGSEVEILRTGLNTNSDNVLGILTRENGIQSVVTYTESGSYYVDGQDMLDLISEITSEEGDDYPFSIEIVDGPDKGIVREVREHTDLPRGWAFRILPTKPPKRVVWMNVYEQDEAAFLHKSRKEAERNASPRRIACIRVEFEEGQFDE